VLSNHDVQRHVTRYGGGETGLRRARAALALMLALPGSVYLYQGEELGLPEVLDLPDEVLQDPMWERSGHTERGRDGCRVPLPWAASGPSLGFGTGGSWLPQPADWAKLSVEAQSGDQDSMLSFYRNALRVRRENPALGAGLTWVDGPAGVLWFERDGVACAVNLSGAVVELPDPGSVLLASSYYGVRDGLLLLPPDTALWWKL
jgi:alpha-glucosidase